MTVCHRGVRGQNKLSKFLWNNMLNAYTAGFSLKPRDAEIRCQDLDLATRYFRTRHAMNVYRAYVLPIHIVNVQPVAEERQPSLSATSRLTKARPRRKRWKHGEDWAVTDPIAHWAVGFSSPSSRPFLSLEKTRLKTSEIHRERYIQINLDRFR